MGYFYFKEKCIGESLQSVYWMQYSPIAELQIHRAFAVSASWPRAQLQEFAWLHLPLLDLS